MKQNDWQKDLLQGRKENPYKECILVFDDYDKNIYFVATYQYMYGNILTTKLYGSACV